MIYRYVRKGFDLKPRRGGGGLGEIVAPDLGPGTGRYIFFGGSSDTWGGGGGYSGIGGLKKTGCNNLPQKISC